MSDSCRTGARPEPIADEAIGRRSIVGHEATGHQRKAVTKACERGTDPGPTTIDQEDEERWSTVSIGRNSDRRNSDRSVGRSLEIPFSTVLCHELAHVEVEHLLFERRDRLVVLGVADRVFHEFDDEFDDDLM